MTENRTNSTDIKKLTKRKKQTNALYMRRFEVEQQLSAILSGEIGQIFKQARNVKPNAYEYLFDETIVYLLREFVSDMNFREGLYIELNRRIWKLLKKFYNRFNNAADFEDFGQKVELTIIQKIFDIGSDCADYAQVNFGDFVVTQAHVFWRESLNKINKEQELFYLERTGNDSGSDSEMEFRSDELSIEKKLILREGIGSLPANIRDAAILLLDGWRIESKDENEPTISKFMNVSSRTIRNWLKEGKSILAGYEGEIR